jgi:hypothetical protein
MLAETKGMKCAFLTIQVQVQVILQTHCEIKHPLSAVKDSKTDLHPL